MPRPRPSFTYGSPDTTRIPDAFVEGASMLIDLHRRGVVDSIGERLRIRRQGGFPGLDVVLLLLLFYAANLRRGLRPVWEDELRQHKVRLAALAGRKRLPSPPAVSRALKGVEFDLIRQSTDWLLGEASGIDEVIKHPAASTWDVHAQPWHLFDLDPTTTALRHRALPQAVDLPEPRRRSEDTGAPGHMGRKRGDIKLNRLTVQHAGSGAWIHQHLSPGNGKGLVDLGLGLDAIVATGDRLGVERSRLLVRMDGEFGHVPAMTACRERDLPFLTRINRASLYEDPDILAKLRAATWLDVPDSLSGPQRLATDLGEVTLRPGEKTRRADDSEYDPVTVRVVASIYKDTGKTGRGRVIGGWRVELFAADLPPASWPAQDCVASYYGRSAEENRFAQEDRELGLDRIISYELPGQELATAVGLFVWNLRLVLGFQSDPPPEREPAPRLRPAPRDIDGPPEHWPPDPAVIRMLDKIDWGALLANRPDWSWNKREGGLLCPDGRYLYVTCVPSGPPGQERRSVIFRRPTGGCEDCDNRSDCYHTVRERGSKHSVLQIPTKIADAIATRISHIGSQPRRHPVPTPALQPRAVIAPLLLPAAARRAHRERFVGATLHVEVELPAPGPPRPRLVADNEREVQCRRKTWQQRVEDYALPDGAHLQIRVQGNVNLRRFLGEQASPQWRRVGGDAAN